MKIIETLDFVFEKESYLLDTFQIRKKDALDALAGIKTAIHWLHASLFRGIATDVTYVISDEPINFPGELELFDDINFRPVIYLNLMTLAEDFKNKEYVLEMKRDNVTCFEYGAFVCLHEFGHLFHGLVGGKGKNKRDRLLDYFERGEYFYQRFIAEMNKGDTYKEKKKYRSIPHEKAADHFASQWLKVMLKSECIGEI